MMHLTRKISAKFKSGGIRVSPALTLFLAVYLLIGSLAHSAAYILPQPRRCVSIFQKDYPVFSDEEVHRITSVYSRFRYHPDPDGKGFLWRRTSLDGPGGATVRTRTLQNMWENKTARRAEVWTYRGQKFHFVDVGAKNLEEDAKFVNRALAEHLRDHPEKSLHVRYDSERILDTTLIERYRRALHDAVIGVYYEEIPHLTGEDIAALETINRANTNVDVFGLLAYQEGGSLNNLNEDGIKTRSLITLQVTYFRERNFLRPSIKGIWQSIGHDPLDQSKFPVEFRVTNVLQKHFREILVRAGLELEHTAELTRYAKFDRLPKPVQARFKLEAIRKAVSRGTKTFLAAAHDTRTRDLYIRDDKFTLLAPFLADGASEPQYLLYMNVGSPQYDEYIERLEMRAGLRPSSENSPTEPVQTMPVEFK